MPEATDVSRLTGLGWQATVPLRHGVEQMYEWFRTTAQTARAP